MTHKNAIATGGRAAICSGFAEILGFRFNATSTIAIGGHCDCPQQQPVKAGKLQMLSNRKKPHRAQSPTFSEMTMRFFSTASVGYGFSDYRSVTTSLFPASERSSTPP